MAHYDRHPSKVIRIRAGEHVVHPASARSDCTVWFMLGEDRWEGLPGLRVGPGRVRVCGVPFWIYDLNMGDEVAVVETKEGATVAERRVHEGTNVTFRVIFKGADETDTRWEQLMADLESFECWCDVRHPGYIALSASVEDALAVEDILSAREQARELQYETGRTR